MVKDEIEFFSPSTEDLDYPAKAKQAPEAQRPIDVNLDKKDKSVPELGNFETDPVPKAWFPTLTKAIWLLSRIYRLVNVGYCPFIKHLNDIANCLPLAHNFW